MVCVCGEGREGVRDSAEDSWSSCLGCCRVTRLNVESSISKVSRVMLTVEIEVLHPGSRPDGAVTPIAMRRRTLTARRLTETTNLPAIIGSTE